MMLVDVVQTQRFREIHARKAVFEQQVLPIKFLKKPLRFTDEKPNVIAQGYKTG